MQAHGGDVFQLRINIRRHRHPELGQHAFDTLDGKGGLTGLIAGAVQAHHQTIAHQLVATYPGDAGEVLDPLGAGALGHQQQQQRECA